MLTQVGVIARKEIGDSLRDFRAVMSAGVYVLIGPGVVYMVSIAIRGKAPGDSGLLIAMMSVFTLVSVFAGGMSVAMDLLAGERERRTLLPLLLNPVSRMEVLLGKWLAVSFFAIAGLMLNLAGFALSLRGPLLDPALLLVLVPLAPLAAALQLTISTLCRNTKEAHTYLSLLVVLPMGLGMFSVFFPGGPWTHGLPLLGQQWLMETWMKSGELPGAELASASIATGIAIACLLLLAARALQREEIVYGN